jgi:hypothetical protein
LGQTNAIAVDNEFRNEKSGTQKRVLRQIPNLKKKLLCHQSSLKNHKTCHAEYTSSEWGA